MPVTQMYTGTLVVEHCYKCGMPFGLSKEFRDERLRDHETFCCPNGHRQHFTGEREEVRLKRQLEYQRERANENRAWAERERASKVATKGHVTRLKRKVAAGQCPCCKESFPDLADHMESTHPDYATHPAQGGDE